MFKNMKIAINEQQPLDEVVKELERLGYKQAYKTERMVKSVYTDSLGYYSIMGVTGSSNITTLTKLKNMEQQK